MVIFRFCSLNGKGHGLRRILLPRPHHGPQAPPLGLPSYLSWPGHSSSPTLTRSYFPRARLCLPLCPRAGEPYRKETRLEGTDKTFTVSIPRQLRFAPKVTRI